MIDGTVKRSRGLRCRELTARGLRDKYLVTEVKQGIRVYGPTVN